MTERAAKKRRLSPPEDGGAVPGFAGYDLEADYAERLAKRKQKDKKQDKLLIKTADGRIAENPRTEAEQDQDDDDVDSFLASDDDGDSGVADLPPKPKPKPQKSSLPPKELIRQAKEELARLAQSLSENPEDHIGQLGALGEFARSENVTVKKLALATQLAVFKDIIPGYRVRPLSEKDMQGKISKEVKKLRGFEQGLLSGYKEYLSTLSSLAVAKSNSKLDQKSAAGLASVAISCTCALLNAVPHFNNRGDLIGIIVKKLAGRNRDADFDKCREAIEKLFQEDEDGHASLDVVTQLTKMMKTKNYSIHESVLNTFLHLRLLSEFAHKAAPNHVDKDEEENNVKKPKQKKEFRTKREKKIMRERKQVEKEMKEADAAVSYEERDKNQSETLKLVFVAYFRILKARVQHLMGAVLEGLAKYSHLINQDFFGDILEALKDLINEAEAALQPNEDGEDGEDVELDEAEQRNATRESLLCIITAFALLQGQYDVAKSANALSLDLSFFIRHLYQTLVPLSMDLDIELSAKKAHLDDPNGLHVPSTSSKDNKVNVATTAVLLLRSLQSVLLPPTNTKSVPPVRVAAFVRQLTILALHLPQKSATAVLELVKSVTKVHGKKVAGLWYTEERKGDGVFNALSQEIESSNPFASTVWEGELLRFHFDPKISGAVKEIEKNVKEARS